MVIDDVFAVIAEGTRRELLGALRSGDKSVGALVEELEVSQPTVSKHLKVLREAGLVSMRAEGQKRYYSLQTAPLDEIVLWLRAFDLPSLQAAKTPDTRLASVAAVATATGISPAGNNSGTARTGRQLFAGRPSSADSRMAESRTADPRTAAAAAAAALESGSAEAQPVGGDPVAAQHLGRTVGRAAERAADLLGQFPKFRRRRS
ncbi:metalloregulator ArsR/SmtB family transcription factor [Arthrobacter sp. zg-Y820]|uniref:ArsR/SmtB family transcription factor n=1 Tax=unclassified Arthrobacter TaxID=235627 RepID=UPI001E5C855F|nr:MULTISPECIES: metalloregulator ArsR/SmtB family transcription factor [unclassified Arthrobacter]MCC9195588.1 metalloregulator ArsR/SmtB family transcription factor [Arthrobacter sp. zg-Y820]MDK1278447.1 metalloregulator ArsR/SmtB family transcription factor [Arthrobacter sp. zg.Y820]WIB09114.1 metalloregulator ArsR/SmtB family transcription factor [Arthrobacter sp. zg-Y820]